MARQHTSYAWSLHADASTAPAGRLSDGDLRGLDYAQELAHAARARSRQNLRRDPTLTTVTIASIAAREGVSASTIRRAITNARHAYFGELTDDAIYKRLQRQHTQSRRGFTRCQHPRCTSNLAAGAHGNQRYCNRHRTPAVRVRRHRQLHP